MYRGFVVDVTIGIGIIAPAVAFLSQAWDYPVLISPIGLLEPIQKQDHGIIPGCPGNPYRFIHTKCPLSRQFWFSVLPVNIQESSYASINVIAQRIHSLRAF